MPIYDQPTRELLRRFASENLQPGQVFRSRDVLDWFKARWPKIDIGTVRATLTALTTNHQSRVHHPVKPGSTHDLFYQLKRGHYRLFNPQLDPTPIYPRPTRDTDVDVPEVSPATGRLAAETLEKVTAKHIWTAVQTLLAGNAQHPFGPSTDYDVLADGEARLPPKAVFGIAATAALGFQVMPDHFTGGLNTICFRKIEDAGYEIVRKGEQSDAVIAPPSDDEQEWSEGGKRMVHHLRSERGRGLSAAKKADFISQHGALFCERCGCDPVKEYGELGAACIEVHHTAVLVSEMKIDHKTKLSDLTCLCANCHRVVHRELRQRTLP